MDPDSNQYLKKILILEDNHDIAEILTGWLASIGYGTAVFEQAENIIQLAEEIKPDLVMLDYLLGGINGGEYCAQLKKNPVTIHIPGIMLSAHQRVIESLGHYGWDAFVAKPFDLEELGRVISQLIQRRATAAQEPGNPENVKQDYSLNDRGHDDAT